MTPKVTKVRIVRRAGQVKAGDSILLEIHEGFGDLVQVNTLDVIVRSVKGGELVDTVCADASCSEHDAVHRYGHDTADPLCNCAWCR